ncbi:hypothetical protein [Streptomyces chattanoogensis]|uniref:hypothetical protein n=1 Tax=Streptomyces chattanoogensis TaxID=66876 RepID=UPI0012FEABD1|nr:hypothetical protein [Streptomyces chattanoogensis]
MMIDSTPALDWASLGQAFASAYSEFEANDFLHAARADEPTGLEIVDAEEPEGVDEERLLWLRGVTNFRDYFPHEAADLTPYIAETLVDVQRAARMENPLTLVGTEQKIGGYRIDVLAKTRIGPMDRFVVIENQLERSDADHLGRLISCAAEVNASHAVWICTEFRPEHLKVMDALRRDSAGCVYVPLVLEGARTKGTMAQFDLAIPETYPTPDDPMREKIHFFMRQAQAAQLALLKSWSIIEDNPGVDFNRYHPLLSDLGYWSRENCELIGKMLKSVPAQRRTRGPA